MTAAPKVTPESMYGSLLSERLRSFADWNQIEIVDSLPPAEVLRLAIDMQTQHIIQTKNPYFAQDLNTAALLAGDRSLLNRFPISAILAPDDCSAQKDGSLIVYDQNFTKSTEKTEILEKVEGALNQLSISGSTTADILVVADELVTNAVFNAPFVDLANTQPGAPRESLEVEMVNGKSARLFMGADGSRIVIGCKDLYGTLNIEKLLRRIKNCYDTSVGANINFSGAGGAGIGSYMIFNSSASYFADVKLESHTLVCCTVPLKMSSRARSNIVKNLHFYSSK